MALVLNCRTSANRFLWYRVTPETHAIRHPRHREVRAWQPEKDQVALIPSPEQSADSRTEGSACERRFKAETPPRRSEFIEAPEHRTAGGDSNGRRMRQSTSKDISVDIL